MNFEDFKSRLSELKISLKAFAEMTNMSYRTIFNYRENQQIPGWVSSYIDLVQKNKSCNNIIISNSILYRLNKKKEDYSLTTSFQQEIILLYRVFLQTLVNKFHSRDDLIKQISNYDISIFRDTLLNTITNKTKSSAVNFINELEDEEIYYICNNMLSFIHILWKTRGWYNKSLWTIDTPPPPIND